MVDHGASSRVSENAQARVVDGNSAESLNSPQKDDRLPERPRTSSGRASRSITTRPNAQNREAEDDLLKHVNPLALHRVGTTFYHFPLPGPVAQPSSAKSLYHPSARKSRTAQSVTFNSVIRAPENMNIPRSEIGMALGSPRHPPTSWQSVPMERYAESPDQNDDDLDQLTSTTRQKVSKWRLLGGLFGGKKAEAPFYQVRPETMQQTSADHESDFTTRGKHQKTRSRGRTSSSSRNSKQRPGTNRYSTAPPRSDLDHAVWQPQTESPGVTVDRSSLASESSRSNGQSPRLLDVEIPSVRMERYSIMFGSVLQNSQLQQPSLLARRQATLDKLKPVNEEHDSKGLESDSRSRVVMSRRVTSPGFSKAQSPAFSLFPNAPRSGDSSSQPGPITTLHRSNTSPATASPSRPSFPPGRNIEARAQAQAQPAWLNLPPESTRPQKTKSHKPSIPGPERELPGPAASAPVRKHAKKWSIDESHLTLSPSENGDDEEDRFERIATVAATKPSLPVTPSHSASNSVSGSSTFSAETTASSISNITTPLSSSTAPYPIVKPLRPRSAGSSQRSLPHSTRVRAPPSVSQNSRPGATRTRSATFGGTPSSGPRRSPAAAIPLSSPISEEDEARLKTAADVSIARQISVSRQQRQLLVPIKTSSKSLTTKSPTPREPIQTHTSGEAKEELKKERVIGSQNLPAPANGINSARLGSVSSPLAAIAIASCEERERASPSTDRTEIKAREYSPSSERLMKQVAKPSTPILVVAGNGVDEGEKGWAGATVEPKEEQPEHDKPSERKTGEDEAKEVVKEDVANKDATEKDATDKDAIEENAAEENATEESATTIATEKTATEKGAIEEDSNLAGPKTAIPMDGEIRVGLTVARESSPARRARDLSQHRKSERVVVEQVIVGN